MKFFTAALLLASASANPFAPTNSRRAAAKAEYVNKLVRGARPTKNNQLTRRLDQNEEYEVDISGYNVKFEQCQFVKSYSDELAQTEDATTVLATKRFVLFRLCPGDCSSCNYNYGEYLIDLDDYLEATVGYFQEYQENMCNACDEYCYQQANDYQNADNQDQQEDNGEEENQEEENQEGEQEGEDNQEEGGRQLQYYNVDCDTCQEECAKIENMEENGYIDASEFLECQMIYDPEDDNKQALYAGPICASGGSKIKIGVFSDEDCLFLDANKDVDDYLMSDEGYNMKLSHALLKSTYTDTCISCKEPQDANDNNANDNNDADQVIEMCEQLYDEAAKCEKTHGFDNGYANYYGYENQLAQEETVCDYMQSLKSGTYDEEGEIIVSGSSSIAGGGKSTTGGQKFALTFFILGTVGLAVYAAMLHSKLVKGGKADLSSSGGAMA